MSPVQREWISPTLQGKHGNIVLVEEGQLHDEASNGQDKF
jgi:hypothetical protein